MSKQDVARFNALPRLSRAPSGQVANEWHFDIRFIHLDPPSHLLFIMQPESTFIHTEMLGSKPMMFFPEAEKDAAPEVVRGLIRAFLTSFGDIGMTPLAPWKLTIEDANLATAVGAEFKRLGVRKELYFFNGLMSHMNFSEIATVAVASTHREDGDDISSLETALACVTIRKNCIPINFSKPVDHTWGARIMQEIDDVLAMVKSKPEHVIKAEGDGGNSEAAWIMDLGLEMGSNALPIAPL
ncbi:hypothetical protein F5146DRAFT_1134465 [Armillaria mellea]|nr:hypothetical protein F5146DRAFT_1134465 [Armillaria mellea]